ncbi:hypothetical protein F4556_007365 [Kitasatospora gansuensis]|uniref:Uncharacterized protein n=1 Tax=Kitasatospora gansuensis TaxID=258050 RepID=A0A7W7SK22_9ACTN|nr:hypothetical protein [Kitasatospora gansuensis]MBB4951830.1 hypothetical protein [Kitasatospora gansuensis]
MTYRLRAAPDVQKIWDALPPALGEELTLALARVCEDPIATTEPYDDADDEQHVMRILHLPSVVAALLVLDHPVGIIRIMTITHLA